MRRIALTMAILLAATSLTGAAAAASAAYGPTTGTTSVASAAVAPSLVHAVFVALVVPKSDGLKAQADINPTSARAMVEKVSTYWSSQTGGKVSFNTAQVEAYDSKVTCKDTFDQTDYDEMYAEALALMPGAQGPNKHLVLIAPEDASYTGSCRSEIATVGAMAGNKSFITGMSRSAVAHVLGHNLGLQHSNSLTCSGAQDGLMVNKAFPGCVAVEYDDNFDVMGASGPSLGEGSLNAVHLDGMNLLPNAVRRIPAASGVTTVRITPLSDSLSDATANRVLKITDPSGANYYVEYRTMSWWDADAQSGAFRPSLGVRVLREDPSVAAGTGSYVLDATPTDAPDVNRSLPVGGTFTAASKKVTIKVTAQDGAGASLQITNGTVPPQPPVAAVTKLADFNRDGRTDLVARNSAGQLWLYPGNGAGGSLTPKLMGGGWNTYTAFLSPGDVTGDGVADVLARHSGGQLRLYPGNGASGLATSRLVGYGWNGMTAITGAGDMTGDGRADVLARDTAGKLWLYPMSGNGAFQPKRQVGAGWNGMTAILGAGDFSGDEQADILARDSAGRLWLYRGNGVGGASAGTLAGTGWQGMTALVTPGNWDRAGGNDVLARDGAGTLWLYLGNNAGGTPTKRQIGAGWNGYTIG